MLSSSLLAQQVTNAPPPAPVESPAPATPISSAPEAAPAPAPTNAPAAPAAKKKKAAAKKKAPLKSPKQKDAAAELKTVPLVPGPAVVDANNVNVRGQAKLNSEVVTRLSNGQAVTVLEEITRNDSAPDEPSAWAKILLPADVHVWIHSQFIDAGSKTVTATRLNLRAGPGENYSILGRIDRGYVVQEISTKGSWIEIEAPTNAYAFMAAQYLKQEATPTAAPAVAAVAAVPATTPTEPPSTTPAEPPATPATVAEPPTVAAAPTEIPDVAPATTPTEAPAVEVPTNAPVIVPVTVTEEPPPKRIVQREGLVRGTLSIQAPSRFALYSVDNGRLIDYLYTTSPNLDLRRYKGLHIIVTGEEGLEERWGNTPVITIQKIQVLD